MVTITLSVVVAVLLLVNIMQAIVGVRQSGRLHNERRKVAFLERALVGRIMMAELADQDDDEECECVCCSCGKDKGETNG